MFAGSYCEINGSRLPVESINAENADLPEFNQTCFCKNERTGYKFQEYTPLCFWCFTFYNVSLPTRDLLHQAFIPCTLPPYNIQPCPLRCGNLTAYIEEVIKPCEISNGSALVNATDGTITDANMTIPGKIGSRERQRYCRCTTTAKKLVETCRFCWVGWDVEVSQGITQLVEGCDVSSGGIGGVIDPKTGWRNDTLFAQNIEFLVPKVVSWPIRRGLQTTGMIQGMNDMHGFIPNDPAPTFLQLAAVTPTVLLTTTVLILPSNNLITGAIDLNGFVPNQLSSSTLSTVAASSPSPPLPPITVTNTYTISGSSELDAPNISSITSLQHITADDGSSSSSQSTESPVTAPHPVSTLTVPGSTCTVTLDTRRPQQCAQPIDSSTPTSNPSSSSSPCNDKGVEKATPILVMNAILYSLLGVAVAVVVSLCCGHYMIAIRGRHNDRRARRRGLPTDSQDDEVVGNNGDDGPGRPGDGGLAGGIDHGTRHHHRHGPRSERRGLSRSAAPMGAASGLEMDQLDPRGRTPPTIAEPGQVHVGGRAGVSPTNRGVLPTQTSDRRATEVAHDSGNGGPSSWLRGGRIR